MRAFWRRSKTAINLSLQTKFTIALISIVVLPAFLTVFLFYGRLYNMVVSNTIRQEQDASAKTAPSSSDDGYDSGYYTEYHRPEFFSGIFLHAGQRSI